MRFVDDEWNVQQRLIRLQVLATTQTTTRERLRAAHFTETWLHETISDSQVNIPGYSFIARNRCVDIHGGVGLYHP